MNIMYIASDNYAGSGAFLSMANLARIIKERYGGNILVVLPRRGDGEELLEQFSIPYIHVFSIDWCIKAGKSNSLKARGKRLCGRFINIFSILGLCIIILREKIDIIHINTSYSYVGAVAGKLCKRQVVWHIREFLEEDQGREIWDKKKGYALINKSEKIIVISNAIFEKYKNIFDIKKIRIILNGIDEHQFYMPEHHILKNNHVKIAIVGTISRYKGQLCAVEAIDILVKKGIENLILYVIGKGNKDSEEELIDLIKQRNLEKFIVLTGYQRNVADWLKNTDIILTCSKAEAFGRTTVEAMFAGCLIIGAEAGGTRELIKENETGLFFQEGNAADLSRKLESVLKNKKRMAQVAQNGQNYMLKNMTASMNAKKIYEEYFQIVKNANEK